LAALQGFAEYDISARLESFCLQKYKFFTTNGIVYKENL
jgi:hypothetical protein